MSAPVVAAVICGPRTVIIPSPLSMGLERDLASYRTPIQTSVELMSDYRRRRLLNASAHFAVT